MRMTTVLSLMVLSVFVLLLGAVWLWRRGESRQKALLMLALAIVIAVNVAIWVTPVSDGSALVTGPVPQAT
jgi:uncharacterized membrane-anchored protein